METNLTLACCSGITGRLRIDEMCALFDCEISGVKPVLSNSGVVQLKELVGVGDCDAIPLYG
jgi:hypothetical protein